MSRKEKKLKRASILFAIFTIFILAMIIVYTSIPKNVYADDSAEIESSQLGVIEEVELSEVYRELARKLNENNIYLEATATNELEENVNNNIYTTEENLLEIIDNSVSAEDIEINKSVIAETYSDKNNTEKPYTDETVEVLTNLLYGEARGIKGDHKKAGVIWCVLNRFDNGHYGKTIIDVAVAPNQFCGYVKDRTYGDINSYNHCKEIVIDVLDRYYTEEQIGRTLPKDYLYFLCVNGDNVFTQKWQGTDYWDWSLGSPYTN